MKKKFIISLLVLLLSVQVLLATPIQPINSSPSLKKVNVYGTSHSPSSPEAGQSVTISCSFSIDYDIIFHEIAVQWRVNGGSFTSETMNENGNTASYNIGSFSGGDFVEYRVLGFGEDDMGLVYFDYDPLSGYYSFTIPPESFVSWSSPAAGATITFPTGKTQFHLLQVLQNQQT
jgi:hypothetical protein